MRNTALILLIIAAVIVYVLGWKHTPDIGQVGIKVYDVPTRVEIEKNYAFEHLYSSLKNAIAIEKFNINGTENKTISIERMNFILDSTFKQIPKYK